MKIIKKYLNVIIGVLVILISNSCKDDHISVKEAIRNHILELCTNCDYNNNTLKTKFNIDAKLYYNKELDSCLLVLINSKGDTLLKLFEEGIGNIYFSKFKKKNGLLFMIKRNYGKTTYGKYNSIISNYDNQKIYLLDEYFLIDTVNQSLISIERPADDSLLKMIQKKFNLTSNIELLYGPFNNSTEIFKDTIDGYKVYYSISSSFDLYGDGSEYKLKPTFSTIQRLGLFKDNVSYWDQEIAHTENGDTVIAREYFSFHDPIKYYGQRHQTIAMGFLVSTNREFKKEIQTFAKNEIPFLDSDSEKKHNRGVISEFRPAMFKYLNGEYYISLFLPNIDEYMESSPSLFHLDTVQWRMNFVPAYIQEEDSAYYLEASTSKYGIILYRDTKIISLFLDKYEIVKVSKGYRLKLKNKSIKY